ncbi:hypothetical protein [Cyanothece sp. BG0011]|uniref:hypothetical protein n=1 Tax=Cyanothece sp. BG0011 TaxID=2082950 RepID=UPI000D1DC95A|nr:hypothetical protein [Cyanothece sp. BG0011]
MNNTLKDSRLDFIRELNKFCEIAPKFVNPELANRLLSSVIGEQTSPIGNKMLDEVENAGIKLTPGLVMKINNTSPEIVDKALDNYLRSYGKGGGNNPSNLFFTILTNEIDKKSLGF